MRTLIISDVHGNLPALEALLALDLHHDQVLCLGDTVNYGPWSDECVRVVDDLPGPPSLIGNHEEFFLSGRYGGKNAVARAFFDHCYPTFTERERISAYAESARLGPFRCVHTLDDRYLFHDSEIEIDQDSIVGHSHQQYDVRRSGFRLANPGSVGQDRKLINRASYAIYDDESGTLEMASITFDIDLVINEMRARSYPQICIDYYVSKDRL